MNTKAKKELIQTLSLFLKRIDPAHPLSFAPSSRKREPILVDQIELKELGNRLGEKLFSGIRIFLEGPLGAGKSTLARFILEGAQVKGGLMGSPSFPIAHEYESRPLSLKLFHVDFYRLKSEREVEEAGLLEPFWDPKNGILAEWSSLFPHFLNRFSHMDEFFSLKIDLQFIEGDPTKRLLFLSLI